MQLKALLAAVLALGAAAFPAAAQEEDDTPKCKGISNFADTCSIVVGKLKKGEIEADDLKIEFNSPTVPAGAILGDDDLALTTVRNFSDLTPQLLAGVNENGELQPGVAIGGAPYWWFEPREDLKTYAAAGQAFMRIVKRTQFGLATKQDATDEPDSSNRSRVGVSLGWQLFDEQDVRTDHYQTAHMCMVEAMEAGVAAIHSASEMQTANAAHVVFKAKPNLLNGRPGLPQNGAAGVTLQWLLTTDGQMFVGQFLTDRSAAGNEFRSDYAAAMAGSDEQESEIVRQKFDADAYNAARSKCREEFVKIQEDSPSLTLNVAAGFVSDNGKYDDLDPERTSVWLAYRSGATALFGQPIVGFVNYNANEKLTLPNDTEVEADRFIIGVGTSFKNNEDESFDFQASLIKTDFDTATEDSNDYRVSLSYSRRITDNMWLAFKAGTTNSDELEDATFAGVELKVDWASMLAGG